MRHWVRIGRTIDALRIIPRVCLIAMGWMTWLVAQWFMALKDPTGAQGAFVSVVYGVIPLVLNFYMQNGTDWSKHDGGRSDTQPER